MTLPPIWSFADHAQCAVMACPSSWTKTNRPFLGSLALNSRQPALRAVGEPAIVPARTVLEIDNLQTHFFTAVGTVRAVDGVSYALKAGETLGVEIGRA